jgi:hypothetical protein
MSIKTRAALRLAAHFMISVTVGAAVYAAVHFLSTPTILTILGTAAVVFFGYQVFKIYVTLEEFKENNKNKS